MIRKLVGLACVAVAITASLALTTPTVPGPDSPGTEEEFATCPMSDMNVDCWSDEEGFCPDHCRNACTVEAM